MALQTPSSPRPESAVDARMETAQIDISDALSHDPIASLDHRSRHHAVTPADAQPGHYLTLEGLEGEVLLIPIEDRITHIGRAGTADLRFEDPRVSRRHAILVRYGRHVRMLDDRSSEGTFVNGTRVVATDLSDGDVVRLGPVSFTYTIVR
ncbi:MAG TPA: FHA domain-containing protein [Solirubrobacteraceae bacterium]|nr:FHA domain-containing protein [Solirubrobacteraceae bacterium]